MSSLCHGVWYDRRAARGNGPLDPSVFRKRCLLACAPHRQARRARPHYPKGFCAFPAFVPLPLRNFLCDKKTALCVFTTQRAGNSPTVPPLFWLQRSSPHWDANTSRTFNAGIRSGYSAQAFPLSLGDPLDPPAFCGTLSSVHSL